MSSGDKPPPTDISDLFPLPALALVGPRRSDTTGSPITPLVTPPLPDGSPHTDPELPGYDQSGPWVVTGLRVYDGVEEWELPRYVRQFHGGASRKNTEIWLPSSGLSATHFMLERRDRGLRLYDLHSAHGTWVMDARIATADLRAGSMFTAKPVTFLALNDAMRRHRPELVEILGTRWLYSPDWTITEAAGSGHIVITAEPGCEQDRLALAIHEMSPRQARDIIEIDPVVLTRATLVDAVRIASKDAATVGATVLLKLGPGATRVDETFLSLLFSSAYGIRVIVLAPAIDDARRALGDGIVSLCRHVPLRPLAYRRDEIGQLLDRSFARHGAEALRAADLLEENQAALQQYSWPANLTELRDLAQILVAYERTGGWRAAESSLGRARSTMQAHTERVGLTSIRVESGRRGPRFTFFKPPSIDDDKPGDE